MLRSQISERGEARRGMVAAQVAVCLTALMGMLALLVDGGILLSERRHAQGTADAAALAAASDLYYNWYTNKGSDPGTAKTSALSVASSNGYTNDGTTSTVTVNIPPQSGNFSGKAGYAEVIVTWNQQRGFSRIFGTAAIPVSARAVAQGQAVSGASSLPGVLLLGNTGTTLTAKGNGTVDVTDPKGYTGSGGSIYVDSNSSNAIVTTGNATVTAPSVYVAGDSSPSGVTATAGSVHTDAPQLPDPLAYLPAPTASTSLPGINVVSLPNGITSSMSLSSNTIYLVGGGGISLQGNNTLTGSNVMIYFTDASASVTLNGNASVTLTPMTTGPYQGIGLFENRNGTDLTLTGNGNMNISGTVYAPSAGVTAVGNGTTDVFASQIIANSMTLKGNGTVNVKFDSNNSYVPSTRNFGLVE
jgi:Flp pilus assembly protein TadG